jgi:hypothetical protein
VLGSITSEKSCYRKLAADEWFKENDLEGAAFEYEVLD